MTRGAEFLRSTAFWQGPSPKVSYDACAPSSACDRHPKARSPAEREPVAAEAVVANALQVIQRLSPVGDGHASVNQLIQLVRSSFSRTWGNSWLALDDISKDEIKMGEMPRNVASRLGTTSVQRLSLAITDELYKSICTLCINSEISIKTWHATVKRSSNG